MSEQSLAEEQLFNVSPSLYTEDVACWIIREGRMVAISTPHEGGGAAIFLNVPDARVIRDWLNKALP